MNVLWIIWYLQCDVIPILMLVSECDLDEDPVLDFVVPPFTFPSKFMTLLKHSAKKGII